MIGYKEPRTAELRILECVDRGLSALGEGIKTATLWHIEHTHNIKLERIVEEPDRFVDALDRMFGGASWVIISLILNEIRKAFGKAVDGDLVKTIRELTWKGSAGFVEVGA